MKINFIIVLSILTLGIKGQSKIIRSEFKQSKVVESEINGSNEKMLYRDIIFDPVSIKLDLVNNHLYWSNEGSGALNRSNLDGTNVITLNDGSIAIQTIAFDYINGKIYWGDINVAKIKRANFDGTGEEYVYQSYSGGGVYGLVLDVESNIMYFTSGSSIYSAKLDGSDVKEIITNLEHPHTLVFNKNENVFYWDESPFGGKGIIKKGNIDGTNIDTIINSNINKPQGFQIDFDDQLIYWIDGANANMYKANLDGTNQELINDFATTGYNLKFSLDLDTNTNEIYWVDKRKNIIQKSNSDGTDIDTIILDFLDDPYELIVDSYNGQIYMTDYKNGIIKSNLDGSNIDLIINQPYMYGIAIDTSNIYYYNSSNKKIIKANLDGSNKVTLFSNIGFVRDIELDKKKKTIYWIDGTADKIFKANLDGTNKSSIIDIGDYAWSLAIDDKNEKIYWSNRSIGKGEINSANLDGSDIQILTKGISQYLGWLRLDYQNQSIYWTERTYNSTLYKINLDGSGKELVYGMKDELRGFDFFNAIDDDGDGFLSYEDCDDNNPDIYPGAEEIPNNGIDEDCDGEDLINAVFDQQKYNIYFTPNPFKESLSISASQNIHSIVLFNSQGVAIKKVSFRNSLMSYNLKTLDLESGIYFVKVIMNNGNFRLEKMIKL